MYDINARGHAIAHVRFCFLRRHYPDQVLGYDLSPVSGAPLHRSRKRLPRIYVAKVNLSSDFCKFHFIKFRPILSGKENPVFYRVVSDAIENIGRRST